MTIGLVALATWLVTAAFGFVLFVSWLVQGITQQAGMQQKFSLPPSYFPRPIVYSHLALAVGGLAIWALSLVTGTRALAWVAIVALLPVALFGFSMFTRWLGSRRLGLVAPPGREAPPESRLPTFMVLCHGAFGGATIVLALLSAIGAGA
jgi:hypothetical protein